MRLPFLLGVYLALPVTLCAQGVTLAADTDYGTFATDGATPSLQFLKKGTNIGASTVLQATALGAESLTRVFITGQGLGQKLFLYESGTITGSGRHSAGTTASTDPKNITPGAHSLMLTGTQLGILTLTVTYVGDVFGTGKASVQVDIGANNTIEFQRAADGKSYRSTFTINVATQLQIRITTRATAGAGPGRNGYFGHLLLFVDPGSSRGGGLVTPYWRGCGPVFTGTAAPTMNGGHNIGLQVTGAFANQQVALVFGAQPVFLKLPLAGNCPLLVAPLMTAGIKSDAQGAAGLSIKTPGPLWGAVYVQAVPVDMKNSVLKASNGLRLDFFGK